MLKTHELSIVTSYATGAEEWRCAECTFAFVQSEGVLILLSIGDPRARHIWNDVEFEPHIITQDEDETWNDLLSGLEL
jgi:hypothetical protein